MQRLVVVGVGALASALLFSAGGNAMHNALLGTDNTTLVVETDIVHTDAFIMSTLLTLQSIVATNTDSILYLHFTRLVDAIDRQLFEARRVCNIDETMVQIEDRITSFEHFKVVEQSLATVKNVSETQLGPKDAARVGIMCQKLFEASERYWAQVLAKTKKVFH